MTMRCHAVAIAVLLATGTLAQPQSKPRTSGAPNPPVLGGRAFATRCAPCHGLDGRGGERAPNIASNPQVQRLSDLELRGIIADGRPDFGMPAFRLIGGSEIQKLVGYLRALQGDRKATRVAGDPQKGRVLFLGKGGCSSCHRVRDEGSFVGSDLSTFASGLPALQLRRAITNPDPNSATRVRLAVASAVGGETFRGTIRNEDNFSLQLQTADGALHFLMKAELASLEYQSQAPMPADLAQRLTPAELDHLVSYLHSVTDSENATTLSEDQP